MRSTTGSHHSVTKWRISPMRHVAVRKPKVCWRESGRFVASWGTGLKKRISRTIQRSWPMMAQDIVSSYLSLAENRGASSVANLATSAVIVRRKSAQSVAIWQTYMSQPTVHTKAQWPFVPGLANLSLTNRHILQLKLCLLRCRVLHRSRTVPLGACLHRLRPR